MGDIPGQCGERAFRCAIGRNEGLAAVGRHRLNVDDRARDLLAPHDPHALLNEEERRAHVDVEDLVEAFLRRVKNIAAIAEPGGVDQRIDAAEALVRLRDHLAAIGDLREVRLDKDGRAAGRRNFARDPLASLGVPAADHEPRRAALAEQPRDGLAQPLRAAGDDGDLAVQIGRPLIGRAGGRAGLGRGGIGHGRFLLSASRRSARAERQSAVVLGRQNETKILFPSQYGTYILFSRRAPRRIGAEWRTACD